MKPEDKGDPLSDRGAPNLSHDAIERDRIKALTVDAEAWKAAMPLARRGTRIGARPMG